jgi:5'(3')-deoxyribonucleotidase
VSRLGLDMDGVLHSWDRAVRDVIREGKGIDVPTSTSWDFIKEYVGADVWRWVWSSEDHIRRMFRGQAYPGAVEGARQLAAMFDEVCILTAGPPTAAEVKQAWLEDHGVPFSKFVLLDHGEPKTRVRCDLYIDDFPGVIKDVMAAPFRARAILVDRPWNAGAEAPKEDARWVRAHGWEGIVAAAEAVAQEGAR